MFSPKELLPPQLFPHWLPYRLACPTWKTRKNGRVIPVDRRVAQTETLVFYSKVCTEQHMPVALCHVLVLLIASP